jgi:hypothetical protein
MKRNQTKEEAEITIHLIPAPDDRPLDSAQYQTELGAFDSTLRSHGIVPQRVLRGLEAVAGAGEPAVWLGQFVVVAKAITPVAISGVVTAIGGYFGARRGRKVEIEVGKNGRIARFKASGYTPKAAERLSRMLLDENRKMPRQAGTKKTGNRKR